MATAPKPWVSYDSTTKTTNIDATVAWAPNSEAIRTATSQKDSNVNLTDYGAKMDPSTGAPEIVTSNVVNTNDYRDKAQVNADYIDKKVTGGKTVTNTVTSNGKTTKTYSDGTTETTDSGVSETTGTPDRRQLLDETKNIYSEQEKLQAEVSKRFDDLKVSGDNAYNDLVENTKKQFAGLRTQLTDANRRFEMKTSQGQYLNNGFRYTPQSSEGMVYDAEQAGLSKLADLNLKESTALQMALTAKNNNDYDALESYTNTVRGIQNDRINTIKEMTTQIKTIEDTDKNIRNMNTNEATVLQSMINSYITTSGEMDASKTEEYYNKKSKELSELMGFTIAPAFVKAQIEGAKASAKLEVNEALTKANGYYTDSLGKPLRNSEGKSIPFEKEDWGTWIEWNTLNVGTYDENGNKVIKPYTLTGGTKSYAETIKDLPPTPFNITVQALSQAFTGQYADQLVLDNVRIPTTVAAFKNLQGGGMQCAEYVNRIMGTSFWDTIEDKLSKATDKIGQVGSAAVWDAGDSKYGHVGVIIADNGDTWTIRSSNIHGDTMVSTDVVPKSSVKGYLTTDAVKNMPSSATGIYDPLQDKNLVQVGNSTEWGIFYDNTTGQTMTGNEAKNVYGKTTQATGANSVIGSDPILRSIAIGGIAFGKNMSDWEREAVLDVIKKYPNSSNQEIALLVKNMNINDPKNTEKALQYLDVFKNMKTPPSGFEAQIANLINKGDTAGLDAYVEAHIERAVKEDVPADEFISSSGYKTGLETTTRLIRLISENKDKIGPFDGKIEKWKSKFKDTPVYNEINTLLQMTQAERRKQFAGSAVTETEMKALENFIGGIDTMTPEKLITMLETVQQKTTSQYQNQRALYRKPDINTTYSAPVAGQSTGWEAMADFSTI